MALPVGLLGALGGVVGSIGSTIFGNRGAKRRQAAADAQNIKFWQMQNAYNTPKQQMQRLKDAGLNPALIYGTSANTGVAGSVAPSRPAPYNVKDPTPSALQSAMITSQVRLQNSQANKNNAETERIQGITPNEVKVKQEKAKAQLILEKLLQEQQNTKNIKSRTEYEIRLRKMGISPTGSTGVNILKALMLGVQYIKDEFLINPQEITRNNTNR